MIGFMSVNVEPTDGFEGPASPADSHLRLNDRVIRSALVARLATLPIKPKAVLEEVRVHNGNAIADVVAVSRFLHCYEIKGATDSIRRLLRQGRFYDLAFMKTTLVTAESRLKTAIQTAPPHWGVMTASVVDGRNVAITYVRGASSSPSYDKKVALLTLWRSELLEVAAPFDQKANQLNRSELTELIASSLTKAELAEVIGAKLSTRLRKPEGLGHVGDVSVYRRFQDASGRHLVANHVGFVANEAVAK